MPAHTVAAARVFKEYLNNERSVPPKDALDLYPVYRTGSEYKIATLAKINSGFTRSDAIKDGFEVGAVIGNIVSMRIPLHFLNEDFSYPGIEYIEVAEKIEPELDKALLDIRANLVHQGIGLPQAYTGKDVIIGVVDWGFDYTHPMFYDTSLSDTRILAAWDQEKKIGSPPPGFSHGAYYNGSEELLLALSDTFSILTDYHGTHVAGIAGGSGGGTPYRGGGIESGFLFSQMRRDVSSSMDAFYWMYQEAQARGKRLVINNSWGGYRNNPLDGTSLLSQAITSLSDLGVVFVFSAGNNGDINFHLKKTFNDDSVRTRIMGFNYTSDQQLWGQTVSMWGENGHPFSVQLRILSETNEVAGASTFIHTDSSPALVDTFLVIGADTVFYNFITDAAHPLNGRPQMTLNVRSLNQSLKKILYAEAESGTVHFWNTRLTKYGGGNWGYGFTAPSAGYVNGDKNYGIGHPALTSDVITVAAHQTDWLLTSFSSTGPRMDEFMKPDISAPGASIISSFNSYSEEGFVPVAEVVFNGRTYEFIRLSGTSMSAPMVTGAVAMLLEADPGLTPAEIKAIVLENARLDNLTGDIGPEGHVRWGHGKLDVYQIISSLVNTGNSEINDQKPELYPNPANGKIYLDGDWNVEKQYRLYNLKGELTAQGQFSEYLDISNLAQGIYIMNISSGEQTITYKVVVNGQ